MAGTEFRMRIALSEFRCICILIGNWYRTGNWGVANEGSMCVCEGRYWVRTWSADCWEFSGLCLMIVGCAGDGILRVCIWNLYLERMGLCSFVFEGSMVVFVYKEKNLNVKFVLRTGLCFFNWMIGGCIRLLKSD